MRKEIGLTDEEYGDFDLADFIESKKEDSSSESYRDRELLHDLNSEE